jgi:glycosyltransferase involved in cell wall biosynthesis
MKIAILSPIHWRTPPRKYGGYEIIASHIAEGLVKKGHDVTLYATGDSLTEGKLKWICPRPIEEDKTLDGKTYQYLHSALPFEDAQSYDIIHNHYDAYPLVFSKLVDTPVVTTIHGFTNSEVINIYQKYSNTYYVSISLADRKNGPDMNWIANVYHGIPVEEYTFNETPKEYFCFLGRICADKGVHLSIQVAEKLGIKLKLAGMIPSDSRVFFEKEVKPHLSSKIEYLGEISHEEKKVLLQDAKGLLHLNTYPEGFGIPLIEAMACGTPVIGMNHGSIPEVIEDKKTGFVVNDVAEAVTAVQNIDQISRKSCRERAEMLFSVERMVNDYEAVYEKMILQQSLR